VNESKLAIFVEGQTERIFIERLITEVASAHQVTFARFKGQGGGASGARQFVRLSGQRQSPPTRYYVQIVDSSTDNRVVSDINDTHANLTRAGFKAVLGIRDVFPAPRASIPAMRAAMAQVLTGTALPVDVVLAVMEVEAWFLGEHNHLAKLDRPVALADVIAQLGFDPSVDNMEDRAHPAEDLHNVYRLVGYAYKKRSTQVERTVNALDYTHLYLTLPARMPSVHELVAALDRFLAA
jgi:hypothetical protein